MSNTQPEPSMEEILASINAKLDAMRLREEAVARLISEETDDES